MNGSPSQSQLQTLEIFRKKIEYYEFILKTHFQNGTFFPCDDSQGNRKIHYICDRCFESLKSLKLSKQKLKELRPLGCLSLYPWWNREDILLNKTDMNDHEFYKYIKTIYTSDISGFQLFHVISSEKEAMDYNPFQTFGTCSRIQKSSTSLRHSSFEDETVKDVTPIGGGGGGVYRT